MKKLSLIVALALGSLMACSIATAQDSTNKDTQKKGKTFYTPEQRLERMSAQLTLTDDQKPKVKAVLEETSKKMQDLAPEDRREKGRALREEETTKLKAILTDEQFTKYQEMSQRRGNRGTGGEKKTETKPAETK